MSRMRDRPTPDIVVIWLTWLVVFVVVFSIAGLFVWKIFDPDADISVLASRIGGITNTLIGAIVGYLAGRGVATRPPPGE